MVLQDAGLIGAGATLWDSLQAMRQSRSDFYPLLSLPMPHALHPDAEQPDCHLPESGTLERLLAELPTPCPAHIEKFQQLYAQRFHVHLTGEQALEQLTHLLVIVAYQQANQIPHKEQPPLEEPNGSQVNL
jgi:hypothetical protein